jgi:cytochrome c oxidase subunit 1
MSNPCGTLFSPSCGDDPTFAEHLFRLIGRPEVHSGALIVLTFVGLAILLGYARRAGRLLPLTVPALWVGGLALLSAVGGVTGIMLGSGDVVLHDSYYAVSHLQYTLQLCAWFAIFAGWYHWFPRASGRAYFELWARLQFWLTFIGANLLLAAQVLPAVGGMQRRFVDYAEAFTYWNHVAWAGACLTAIGTLCALASVAHGHVLARRSSAR